jgi:glycosyltransferase involved in cell wall biosynthesis
MRHLIVSREYPPAPYPPGGIGTYVATIARLLAEAGESVHVIAQQWTGAPRAEERLVGGRLTIHRVPLEHPADALRDLASEMQAVPALAASAFPPQAFAWQAALRAEQLVEREGIDVIEAQEWEAPLYYFQLRRALGLGPTPQPPCIVHLHSPTELIFRYNEWPTDRPDYLPTKRLEDHTIAAADAWLCPSRFLARQVETEYALEPDAVDVIPLPLGGTPFVSRPRSVWERGPVCFVGRLEPRKGVVEWVDAAVRVALGQPWLEFEFLGTDMAYLPGLSVHQVLERRIPAELRGRFHFHGSRPRSEVIEHLARARAAVVPSRWENYPNACVEALASGLPVIASPDGGMRELVQDGLTGWIAPTSAPEGLAEALRRALATDPEALAAMGRAAAEAAGRLCDDARIVACHIEFRRAVAARGADRSRRLPPNLPWSRRPGPGAARPVRGAAPPPSAGLAVIVAAGSAAGGSPHDVAALRECVASVDAQSRPPAARVLVGTDALARSDAGRALLAQARADGWTAAAADVASGERELATAVAELCAGATWLGVVVVEAPARLAPTFLERGADVLHTCPEVGLVSSWADLGDGTWRVEPGPTLPWQLLENGAPHAPLFRVEALAGAGGLRDEVAGAPHQLWDAATAVLAAGWAAVTYPERLVWLPAVDAADARIARHLGRPRALRQVLERVPPAVAAAAPELLAHLAVAAERRDAAPSWPFSGGAGARLHAALILLADVARAGVRRPGAAVGWLAPRLWRAARRAVGRGNGP